MNECMSPYGLSIINDISCESLVFRDKIKANVKEKPKFREHIKYRLFIGSCLDGTIRVKNGTNGEKGCQNVPGNFEAIICLYEPPCFSLVVMIVVNETSPTYSLGLGTIPVKIQITLYMVRRM